MMEDLAARDHRAGRRAGTVALALAALALGACATPGRAPSPAIVSAMPATWSDAAPSGIASPITADWWRSFESPELSAMIAAALAANPDVVIAAERVRQSEAQAGIAGASLFPELGFNAGTSRRESRPDGGDWSRSDGSSGTLSASYALDLWGRNAAGVRAAEASLRASRFDQETVRLTLLSGVASAYFQVLSLRGRLATARENATVAERVFTVVDARVRFGAASPLDRARQQAAVLGQRASIPPLELQERQTLFALALLLGQPPEGFTGGPGADATLTSLAVPHAAPGLPVDLLLRRPDLASAEAQLAAAHANVTAARAALLPAIQLTGSAGLASTMLVNFLNAPSATLALGASLAQTIFDGGGLHGAVDVASSRERELVETYRKSILVALSDVESALAAARQAADQESLQQQIVEQARLSLRLAEIRYREGVDDLISLLDAQRTLFQSEDALALARLSRLQASISLFKALGGGWSLTGLPVAALESNSGNR